MPPRGLSLRYDPARSPTNGPFIDDRAVSSDDVDDRADHRFELREQKQRVALMSLNSLLEKFNPDSAMAMRRRL
jgi:hypothetical protein